MAESDPPPKKLDFSPCLESRWDEYRSEWTEGARKGDPEAWGYLIQLGIIAIEEGHPLPDHLRRHILQVLKSVLNGVRTRKLTLKTEANRLLWQLRGRPPAPDFDAVVMAIFELHRRRFEGNLARAKAETIEFLARKDVHIIRSQLNHIIKKHRDPIRKMVRTLIGLCPTVN